MAEVTKQPLDHLYSVSATVPPNLSVVPASQSCTFNLVGTGLQHYTSLVLGRGGHQAQIILLAVQEPVIKLWGRGVPWVFIVFQDKHFVVFRCNNQTVVVAVPSCTIHSSVKDLQFILYCETLKRGWLIALSVANFSSQFLSHLPYCQ